jgi:hypothetical protein
MAVKLDWSSLDNRGCHVMAGDGFVINDYAHPSFIRYIDGHRVLTLSYDYVDETEQRGRRYLFLRNYAIQVQVQTDPIWDDGMPIASSEATTVFDRICRTFERYKKRPCKIVIDDKLYQRLAAIEAKSRAKSNLSPRPS